MGSLGGAPAEGFAAALAGGATGEAGCAAGGVVGGDAGGDGGEGEGGGGEGGGGGDGQTEVSVLHEPYEEEDHRELADHVDAMSALLQSLRAGVLSKVYCGWSAREGTDTARALRGTDRVCVARRGVARERRWRIPAGLSPSLYSSC